MRLVLFLTVSVICFLRIVRAEPAASKVLDELGLSALLDCGMSLGEGSGAVAVMPLLKWGCPYIKA